MRRCWTALMVTVGATVGLTGCHNLGYNTQSANNALTPSTSQTEYTRTWQPTGQPGQYSQNVTTGAPAETKTDPANPNYTGAPAQSAPPASAPGH